MILVILQLMMLVKWLILYYKIHHLRVLLELKYILQNSKINMENLVNYFGKIQIKCYIKDLRELKLVLLQKQDHVW